MRDEDTRCQQCKCSRWISDALEACLHTPLSGPLLLVLVSSFVDLSRMRPPLSPELLPVVLRVGADVPNAPPGAQANSLAHALRTALLALLRSPHVAGSDWQGRIVAVLSGLGQQDAAESVVRQSERHVKRERESADRCVVFCQELVLAMC